MDRIIKSLLAELLKNQDITSEGDPKDFEKLANYSIISNEYSKTFNIDITMVGDGDDTGIDGIAIIVNGQLIENIEEIDGLLQINNSLEVTYVFIQSKTSETFNVSSFRNFVYGVLDFFSEKAKMRRNEEIEKFVRISNYLYEKASYFRENPTINLYYVTTGKVQDDKNIAGAIQSARTDLDQKNLFEKIHIHPYGAKEITKAYRKTKEEISTTINFSNRVTLPAITGISQAYIGLLPFDEFIKIVSGDEDSLLNVFEDNVRDFQGDNNDVNNGIAKTLVGDDPDIFSVLNNGVTIVASSISPTGDQFTIKDYQIVNGCQTSNVLFNNRKIKSINNVQVPVKIIATTDDEVKTRITLATNNQTPIKKEQLAALTQFQKHLELYFNSYSGDNKLYFERRSKQYHLDNSILKTKIITVPFQIKSFAAMFLDDPHSVTSFYGSIVKKLNEGKARIFTEDHQHAPYYASALAYYKLETHFRKKSIDSSYKKVRFHILMLFRILNEPYKLPNLNSKKINDYCDHLLGILKDDNKSKNAFIECINIIDQADFDKTNRNDIKVLAKTKILIEAANSYCNSTTIAVS